MASATLAGIPARAGSVAQQLRRRLPSRGVLGIAPALRFRLISAAAAQCSRIHRPPARALRAGWRNKSEGPRRRAGAPRAFWLSCDCLSAVPAGIEPEGCFELPPL